MTNYLWHLVPWYVWTLGVAAILVLFIPGVGTIVLGLVRTAGAAWALLPHRVKLVIGCVAALAALVVLHFWDEREKVNAAIAACDARHAAEIAAQRAAYELQVTAIRTKQQEVVTRTVIEYRDRIKIVKEKDDAIQQEIESHVLDSPLLAGWVRFDHDAAARGDLSGDPRGAPDSAPPVEAGALLSTVAENYGTCRAEFEKLVSLQNLVKSLEGVKP